MTTIQGRVRATNGSGRPVAGEVVLVFTDALASGTSEYVPVTYLLLKEDDGQTHVIYPRDVINIVDK